MSLNRDCTVLRNLGQRMSHGPYCANDDKNNLISCFIIAVHSLSTLLEKIV